MTPAAPKSSSDDERSRLEAERDFLLRSLDDLDREREEGGIDDDTFAVLHADYTARAASVTRRLAGRSEEDRPDRGQTVRRDPRWGLTALALGIIVLTVTLGVVIFAAPRDPGESLTGNDQNTDTPTTDATAALEAEFARLQGAVDANPDDFDARMELGLFLFQQGAYLDATKHLVVAAKLRPDDVEAQSFYGWATWQLSQQAPDGDGRDQLIGIALEHLAIAVDLAPQDASANTFYGVALLRSQNAAAAIPYLERAVELAGDQAPPMLAAALEEARATVAGSTSTATPTDEG